MLASIPAISLGRALAQGRPPFIPVSVLLKSFVRRSAYVPIGKGPPGTRFARSGLRARLRRKGSNHTQCQGSYETLSLPANARWVEYPIRHQRESLSCNRPGVSHRAPAGRWPDRRPGPVPSRQGRHVWAGLHPSAANGRARRRRRRCLERPSSYRRRREPPRHSTPPTDSRHRRPRATPRRPTRFDSGPPRTFDSGGDASCRTASANQIVLVCRPRRESFARRATCSRCAGSRKWLR
jgi:hypothetical protein